MDDVTIVFQMRNGMFFLFCYDVMCLHDYCYILQGFFTMSKRFLSLFLVGAIFTNSISAMLVAPDLDFRYEDCIDSPRKFPYGLVGMIDSYCDSTPKKMLAIVALFLAAGGIYFYVNRDNGNKIITGLDGVELIQGDIFDCKVDAACFVVEDPFNVSTEFKKYIGDIKTVTCKRVASSEKNILSVNDHIEKRSLSYGDVAYSNQGTSKNIAKIIYYTSFSGDSAKKSLDVDDKKAWGDFYYMPLGNCLDLLKDRCEEFKKYGRLDLCEKSLAIAVPPVISENEDIASVFVNKIFHRGVSEYECKKITLIVPKGQDIKQMTKAFDAQVAKRKALEQKATQVDGRT